MCDISEEFRAALSVSGGSRRTPPTLPPPDLAGGGDEEGGGGEQDEEEEEEDRLSALPDDVLLLILCRLRSAAAAARTSLLSGRWRRLWAQLPELWFPHPAEPVRPLPWPDVLPLPATLAAQTRARWGRLMAYLSVRRSPLPAELARALSSSASARAVLTQHSAPSLWTLSIIADDVDPADTTAVLRLAAPRLTSTLFFGNVVPEAEGRWNEEMAEAVVRGAIELPCFDRAERLLLNLGYLCLTLPPSGVFAKLTELVLSHVRFQGASDIGDTFSSARCPSLRLLSLEFAQGVSHLSICSESLLRMHLHTDGLQQLTVVSPMLREMHIRWCFKSHPVADITAPVLEKLWWDDAYDPRSVQLGKLAQLHELGTSFYAYTTHGLPEHQYNLGNIMLLQRYRKIADLRITINYPISLVHIEYLMEALTLPRVKNLHLILVTRGHRIGSCVFHFLKICTSIRRLFLEIQEVMKEKTSCLPGCFCHGKEVWEIEALVLNSLQELHICGFNGSDYDFAFVKRLLRWAGKLKSVDIDFDHKTTVDEELCKELLGLSGPETCMKIYVYRNGAKVMYTPVG